MTSAVEPSRELEDLLGNYYRDTLGLRAWRRAVRTRTGTRPRQSAVSRLARFVNLEGKSLLDVGCGFGDLPAEAAKFGARTVGLDADGDWVKAGSRSMDGTVLGPALLIGDGEALPFTDESFDIVTSNFALEHTPDPSSMIGEMARVLRPGGFCYINAPNYLFPWEQHYSVPWVPFLPKRLARGYLRLLGRNPAYVDHIRYITPYSVRRALRQARLTEKVDVMREMVRSPDLVAGPRARTLFRILKRLLIPDSILGLGFPIMSIISEKPAAGTRVEG